MWRTGLGGVAVDDVEDLAAHDVRDHPRDRGDRVADAEHVTAVLCRKVVIVAASASDPPPNHPDTKGGSDAPGEETTEKIE